MSPTITDWIQAVCTGALLVVAFWQWRTYTWQAEIMKEQTAATKYIAEQGYLERYAKIYFMLYESIQDAKDIAEVMEEERYLENEDHFLGWRVSKFRESRKNAWKQK